MTCLKVFAHLFLSITWTFATVTEPSSIGDKHYIWYILVLHCIDYVVELVSLVFAIMQAISMDYDRKMDYPSNGVSILGCLRPAFLDEESDIRRLFTSEDRDDYSWEVQGSFTFSWPQNAVFDIVHVNISVWNIKFPSLGIYLQVMINQALV